MAQWLRTLAILLEDPGLILSTQMVAHTVTLVPRDPMSSFGLHWHYAQHSVQADTPAKHPNTKKNKIILMFHELDINKPL